MRSLIRAGRGLPFVGDDLTVLWQVPDSQVGHDVLIVHLALYVDPPKKVPPTWDLEPQIGAAPHPGCGCGTEAPAWGGASTYGLGHPFAEAADLKRRDMSC